MPEDDGWSWFSLRRNQPAQDDEPDDQRRLSAVLAAVRRPLWRWSSQTQLLVVWLAGSLVVAAVGLAVAVVIHSGPAWTGSTADRTVAVPDGGQGAGRSWGVLSGTGRPSGSILPSGAGGGSGPGATYPALRTTPEPASGTAGGGPDGGGTGAAGHPGASSGGSAGSEPTVPPWTVPVTYSSAPGTPPETTASDPGPQPTPEATTTDGSPADTTEPAPTDDPGSDPALPTDDPPFLP